METMFRETNFYTTCFTEICSYEWTLILTNLHNMLDKHYGQNLFNSKIILVKMG